MIISEYYKWHFDTNCNRSRKRSRKSVTTKCESTRRKRYVSLASMFVGSRAFLKVVHVGRHIGLFYLHNEDWWRDTWLVRSLWLRLWLRRFSSHWIVSIVIVIVRKTKPFDPYDDDALTTSLTATMFDSHRVLTLLWLRLRLRLRVRLPLRVRLRLRLRR